MSARHHPDPSFPRLHGRPARGWVNDPNGCSYADGRYHVFFQHNPASPLHDAVCWGHVSSEDLVRWREEPIALAPREGELDRFGCWSGCVLDDDGVPTAVYSAAADADARCVVLLARGDREMRTWRQGRRPVAPLPPDPPLSHARDPFVFTLDGRRYAIQGAGHAGTPGAACVLVYGCEDLESWTPLGPLLTSADPLAAAVAPAHIWECPNLFRLGERWVLVVSLWSSVAGVVRLVGARYLAGDLRLEDGAPRFRPQVGGEVDRGACFYAPQVLARDDRALLWGWAREEGRSQDDIDAAGWAGTLTFCRELALEDDALVSRPARELRSLRRAPLDVAPGAPIAAGAFEVEVEGAAGSLSLVDGGKERLVAELGAPGARVLVDGSVVEAFVPGAPPLTARAYPTATSVWTLRAAGAVRVRGWTLEA